MSDIIELAKKCGFSKTDDENIEYLEGQSPVYVCYEHELKAFYAASRNELQTDLTKTKAKLAMCVEALHKLSPIEALKVSLATEQDVAAWRAAVEAKAIEEVIRQCHWDEIQNDWMIGSEELEQMVNELRGVK